MASATAQPLRSPYAAFIEEIPVAAAMLDGELRYLATSRRWREDFKTGDRPLIGVSHYEVFPELAQELREVHRRALAGEVVRGDEHESVLADGSRQWSRFECRPWYEAGSTVGGIFIFTEDVTERVLARRKLLESEARLRHALCASGEGLWDWDLRTGLAYLSPRYLEIVGQDADAPAHRDLEWFRGIVHPEDFERVLATMETHFSGGSPTSDVEYRVLHPGGTRWILGRGRVAERDEAGKPLRFVGTIADITERRCIQDALARESERNRMFLRMASDGIHILDAQGTILEASDSFCEMLGYERAEVIGMHVSRWDSGLPPESIPEVIRRQIEKRARSTFETRHRRKDGSEFPVEITGCALDLDGRPVLFNSSRDITARKEAERALIDARSRAEEANQAKSAFLATMSHEIRTPMNGILGMAQLLQGGDLCESERQDDVRLIIESGEALLTLLNDILDLSKVEAGRVELESIEFRPAALLRDSAALFQERASEKGLHLEWAWAGAAEASFRGDAGRLRQMLSNLASNAIKFTASGSVRLEGRAVAGPGSHCMLEFSVQDTGAGIPRDRQASLFQPFSQADASTTRKYGGSGLGLSIVRSLAECMGGSAWLESEEGRGTRVCFRVNAEPASPGPAPATAPRTSPTPRAAQGQGMVLVVEDNPTNRKVASGMLRKQGVGFECAHNGREALDLIESGARPDLVLMDCQMPVMDGFEATRRIRALEAGRGGTRVPIVALTAGAFSEDRERCIEAGMDDFLAKPLNLRDFQAMLEKWLALA